VVDEDRLAASGGHGVVLGLDVLVAGEDPPVPDPHAHRPRRRRSLGLGRGAERGANCSRPPHLRHPVRRFVQALPHVDTWAVPARTQRSGGGVAAVRWRAATGQGTGGRRPVEAGESTTTPHWSATASVTRGYSRSCGLAEDLLAEGAPEVEFNPGIAARLPRTRTAAGALIRDHSPAGGGSQGQWPLPSEAASCPLSVRGIAGDVHYYLMSIQPVLRSQMGQFWAPSLMSRSLAVAALNLKYLLVLQPWVLFTRSAVALDENLARK